MRCDTWMIRVVGVSWLIVLFVGCVPNGLYTTAFPEERDWRFGVAMDSPRMVTPEALSHPKADFMGPVALVFWLAYSPVPAVTLQIETHEAMGLALRGKLVAFSERHWAVAGLLGAGFTGWSETNDYGVVQQEGFVHFYEAAILASVAAFIGDGPDEPRLTFSAGPKLRVMHVDATDVDEVDIDDWIVDPAAFGSLVLDIGGSSVGLEVMAWRLGKMSGVEPQWMPSFGVTYSYGW